MILIQPIVLLKIIPVRMMLVIQQIVLLEIGMINILQGRTDSIAHDKLYVVCLHEQVPV